MFNINNGEEDWSNGAHAQVFTFKFALELLFDWWIAQVPGTPMVQLDQYFKSSILKVQRREGKYMTILHLNLIIIESSYLRRPILFRCICPWLHSFRHGLLCLCWCSFFLSRILQRALSFGGARPSATLIMTAHKRRPTTTLFNKRTPTMMNAKQCRKKEGCCKMEKRY